MLTTWEYLYVNDDAFMLETIDHVHHFGKGNEKPRVNEFLACACKRVSVEHQFAQFAVLFSNHKVACVYANSYLTSLGGFSTHTVRMLQIMFNMLYPDGSMMQHVNSLEPEQHCVSFEHEPEMQHCGSQSQQSPLNIPMLRATQYSDRLSYVKLFTF